MRYVDPESRGSRGFRNYDTRERDVRARGPRRRADDGGRWERGAEARPNFERGGRDTDRWDHGRAARDRDSRDNRERGEGLSIRGRGSERDLEERLGERLDYRDDGERERDDTDPGRAARADAWRSAARLSPPQRRSPPPRSASPRRSRSRSLDRRSANSDMVMDDE